MTNEEKARELAYNTAICEGTWSCLGSSEEDESICMKCNKYHRILEMAEWKDSQIPDYGVIINGEIYESVMAKSLIDCDRCDLNSYCERKNELQYDFEQPCKLFDKDRIFKKIKR